MYKAMYSNKKKKIKSKHLKDNIYVDYFYLEINYCVF